MTALLLSHQRCGSSALTRFLRVACGIRAAMEVLNRRPLSRSLPEWESAAPDVLARHISQLLAENEVVKHIYGDHEPPFDARLVGHELVSRVVLLWREDVEAAALSAAIARATGHYNRRPGNGAVMRPIRPGEVRRRADQMRRARQTAESTVQASGKPVLRLCYESLYQPSEAERRRRARDLIDFLGLKAGDSFDDAFAQFLAPDHKINDTETYEMIPNFDQLQREFPTLLSAGDPA